MSLQMVGILKAIQNDFRSIILTGNENLWEYGQARKNVLNQAPSGAKCMENQANRKYRNTYF